MEFHHVAQAGLKLLSSRLETKTVSLVTEAHSLKQRAEKRGYENCLEKKVDLYIGSHSVAQAGVQWHDLSLLQPLPLGSSDSLASASRVAGITIEMGFYHIALAGLALLSSDSSKQNSIELGELAAEMSPSKFVPLKRFPGSDEAKTTFPTRPRAQYLVSSHFRVCHVTLRSRHGGSRGAGRECNC
ncbi:hypothetical protein AAY473_011760 [Plecturocebus cupreus]